MEPNTTADTQYRTHSRVLLCMLLSVLIGILSCMSGGKSCAGSFFQAHTRQLPVYDVIFVCFEYTICKFTVLRPTSRGRDFLRSRKLAPFSGRFR